MKEVLVDDVKFIELDLAEVIGADAANPPKRRFWDFFPHSFVSFLRHHLNGWPRMTPYERWLVSLMVKLTVVYADEQTKKHVTKNEEYFYHYSPGPAPKDDKDWN